MIDLKKRTSTDITTDRAEGMCLHHYCAYPGLGGAGLAADRLVRGLRRVGCDTKLFGTLEHADRSYIEKIPELDQYSDRLIRRWRANQLSRLPVGYRGVSPAGTPFFSDRSCHGLAMTKTFNGASVLHFHWVCDLLDYQDTIRRIPRKVPIVWTLHDMSPFTGGCSYSLGCDGYENNCSVCPHVLSPLAQREVSNSHKRKRLSLESLPNPIVCVSPSDWMTRSARNSRILGQVPCVTIPNGIDLNTFHPRLRMGARRSLSLEGERLVVLFASANIHNPLKSVRSLQQSLQAAGLNQENSQVVYVGERPSRQLPQWWRWLGNLRTEGSLARCFVGADLTVVPSIADNSPNVVAESLACGTPVVASRVGGIPELVEDGSNGFLYKSGDGIELSMILRSIRKLGPSARESLRIEARRSAEACLDIRKVAQQYLDLYAALLEDLRFYSERKS